MKNKGLRIDIMENGHFLCQMEYTRPAWVNELGQPTYNMQDLAKFVYSKRPSLRGRNIQIYPTDQKVVKY